MVNRTKNYSAFYVAEPFNESNLGAHAAKDFCFYNLLKAWKAADNSFPFINAHDATYNVRDGSDWEGTLKPRLHQRLSVSKNVILFLSERTLNSRALREEIEYGIGTKGLPVIVVYPDYSDESSLLNSQQADLNNKIKSLWDNLPRFRELMGNVPTLHIPMKKETIRKALDNSNFTVQNKCANEIYFYK